MASIASISLDDLLEMDLTTATKSVAVSAAEAPAIVSVITRADIERYGFTSVAEALSIVPGVYVVDDFVTSNVVMRGIHGGVDSWNRTIKFMVDGNPMQQNSTGGALLGPEFIPIEAVESIELIRGPGSALYGPNAFLGVVNVITRKSKDGVSGVVSERVIKYSGADISSSHGAVVGAGLLDNKLSVTLAASGASVDRSGVAPESTQGIFDKTTSDRNKPLSMMGRASYDAGPYGTLELQTIYQRLDSRAHFNGSGVYGSATHLAQSNQGTFAHYRLSLGKRDGVDASLSDLLTDADEPAARNLELHAWGGYIYSRTLPDELLDVGNPLFTYHRRRRNRMIQTGLEASYVLGKNALLVGAEFFQDTDEGDRIADIRRSDGSRVRRVQPSELVIQNTGVYAQLMMYPLARIGLTAGLRYDDNDYWGTSLNSRAAASLRLLDNLHAKLLFGTSFVPPAPSQLRAVALTNVDGLAGNEDLQSQTAKTFEAGLVYKPLSNLSIDVNGFYTKVDNRVENVAHGTLLQARNLTSSETLGAEAAARFIWRFLFADGDLSYQHTTLADPKVTTFQWQVAFGDPDDVLGGHRPPNAPQWIYRLRGGVTLPEYHVECSVNVQAVTNRKSSIANINVNGASYLLDGYTTLGFALRTLDLQFLEGRPTHIALHGSNILNTKYANGGAGGIDIPGRPTRIILNVRQDF